jgi:hypothetical protein
MGDGEGQDILYVQIVNKNRGIIIFTLHLPPPESPAETEIPCVLLAAQSVPASSMMI